jgi:hypothetical protein
LAVEQVIGEIEAPDPGISFVEVFHLAEIFNQLVFGRPIDAVGCRERILVEVI